jgi:hypothetical protein
MPLGGFRLPPLGASTNFQLRNTASNTPRPQLNPAGGAQKKGPNGNSKIAEVLKTPNAGVAGTARSSLINHKPMPGEGRPKPKPKPVAIYPQCTAMYDYEARDVDELSIKEGDTIDILKERKLTCHSIVLLAYINPSRFFLHRTDDGGWWRGKLCGKEGLFPANYVSKI